MTEPSQETRVEWPEPSRTCQVTSSEGLVFDVLEWGPEEGAPLLAIHGFPQSSRNWSDVAHELAAHGVRTIAFDTRGVSRGAQAPLDSYTLAALGADAIAVADGLGLGRFHLTGFGMGALQTWYLASLFPERVASATPLRFPHPGAFAAGVREDAEQRESWEKLGEISPPLPAARAFLANDAAQLRAFLAGTEMGPGSDMPEPARSRTIERMLDEASLAGAIATHLIEIDEMAAVPACPVPTTFIWSAGPALTRATAERVPAYVTGPLAQVKIEGSGHWLLERAPSEVAEVLLAQIDAAR